MRFRSVHCPAYPPSVLPLSAAFEPLPEQNWTPLGVFFVPIGRNPPYYTSLFRSSVNISKFVKKGFHFRRLFDIILSIKPPRLSGLK